jgi:hypothetical protein
VLKTKSGVKVNPKSEEPPSQTSPLVVCALTSTEANAKKAKIAANKNFFMLKKFKLLFGYFNQW